MGTPEKCTYCGYDVPLSAERCPHCARPGLFPNVRTVALPEEQQALNERYQAALHQSELAGSSKLVEELERVVGDSQAVIARPLTEVERLAASDKQGYATYYQLIQAEARLPDGDKWDVLRRMADDALFPGYKENIRFAALAPNGIGLWGYGDCSIALKTSMIEHRATVFEENSARFMERHDIKIGEAGARIRGYRALWGERAKLAVAKLAGKLGPYVAAGALPGLVLDQGAEPENAEFIEVHIWGPMTVRTVERITWTGRKKSVTKVRLKALREHLARFGVELKEAPR